MGLLSDRRRHSGFYSRPTTINILRFFWLVIVVWCEVGAFFWSLRSCRWPDRAFKRFDKAANPGHVMLVADPHFRASSTVFPATTSSFSRLSEFFVNLNLRKSWNAVSRLNPHIVIVLGDMLDQGRAVMTDDQYELYYKEFRRAFKLHPYIQFYFVTGNHDVGLGSHRTFSSQARRRFRQQFGPEQQVFEFGNHTFVAIDAPALVDEDYRRHAAEIDFESWVGAKAGPISFVKAVKSNAPPPNKPTILLSHIPLARPDKASCGPDREAPKGIRRGAGYGFQNLLGKETTHFVLQSLKPVLVFSGDDHDFCDYVHRSSDEGTSDVREVTVKAFTVAAEEIRRPGFHLLSLYTPPGGTGVTPRRADIPCFLPDQGRAYSMVYFPCFVLTVLYLTYVNYTLGRSTPASTLRKPQPLRMTPGRSGGGDTLPITPSRLGVRRQASFQTLGPLTPRSRPASPRPTSAMLIDEEDAMVPTPSTASIFANQQQYPMSSPLLPSPFINDEPESFLPDKDEEDVPRTKPEGGAVRRWLRSDGRRRWVERFLLDGLNLRLGGTKGRGVKEKLWSRVFKDLLQTAWPPCFVAGFIWWRLFSW